MKNNLKKNILTTLFVSSLSFSAVAADFGVELMWNTSDANQVLDSMADQRAAFGELIKSGEVKDMFVFNSSIEGKPMALIRFVIDGEDQADVENKLKDLPLYKKELVKVSHVQPLGNKWLDNTPAMQNYGVTFTWREDIDALEMDRVLGIDLQRVISLNQAGLVTSSYLNTQKLANGIERPVYHVAFLAKDAAHARELSKQFEAVNLGYANVDVQYLGHKVQLVK
ncbi:hypothetical protein A3K86_21075 [Photobacterium jeanii]|uniref:Uncharacterized protein n=1 Tax=Photobacterium jeanii TaxID=858640 RepID=A0A178K2U8_9GAMM|nr:hypothetical protein [Photobacterium jeanii]OAN11437.1 hypothetical protein A3K86_21075 [Photobacterium jeanii]PST90957.1 hypothetical protein C9I91_10180 [Photobacterium jeanii]